MPQTGRYARAKARLPLSHCTLVHKWGALLGESLEVDDSIFQICKVALVQGHSDTSTSTTDLVSLSKRLLVSACSARF